MHKTKQHKSVSGVFQETIIILISIILLMKLILDQFPLMIINFRKISIPLNMGMDQGKIYVIRDSKRLTENLSPSQNKNFLFFSQHTKSFSEAFSPYAVLGQVVCSMMC